jgi:DNA-binding NarL/FixJ family response regulator
MNIKLLVADDHDVVRTGLKSLLNGSDVKIVGEAATGEAVLRLTKKLNPDVVLLDIQMPDKDGLWALGRLKVDFPEVPVLIFSAFDNPAFIARAVALGAHGYLLKSTGKKELVEAIHTAAAGKTIWTREELRRVTGALATPRLNSDVEVPLTQRESEVLKQLAQGATNKEIAVALHISYETVRSTCNTSCERSASQIARRRRCGR